MSEVVKIVYNACHGGFGLSEKAVRRYAAIKGFDLYPEHDRFSFTTWWLVDKNSRPVEPDPWHLAPIDDRQAFNKEYAEKTFTPRDLDRADETLVAVVEELGSEANGPHANLQICEVKKGSQYRIDEYDGFESIETPESYEWRTA